MIDYWPIFDNLAIYGHFFNNLIVIFVAIYINNSFFMYFNVCLVCIFYMIATISLNLKANKNSK